VIRHELTVLIDPGHFPSPQKVFLQMEADGVSPEKGDLLLITHSHLIISKGSKPFWTSPSESPWQREGGAVSRGKAGNSSLSDDPGPAEVPDRFLLEGRKTLLGTDAFRSFLAPGLSTGSLCLYWRSESPVHRGCHLQGGIGRTDFPEGNPVSLRQSIRKMFFFPAGNGTLLPATGDRDGRVSFFRTMISFGSISIPTL